MLEIPIPTKVAFVNQVNRNEAKNEAKIKSKVKFLNEVKLIKVTKIKQPSPSLPPISVPAKDEFVHKDILNDYADYGVQLNGFSIDKGNRQLLVFYGNCGNLSWIKGIKTD